MLLSRIPRDCNSPAFSGMMVFSAAWRLLTSALFFSSRCCTSAAGEPCQVPRNPGIVPGVARGAVAVIHRSRRGVLSGDRIPGIQPPQAPILADPQNTGIDKNGGPSAGVPGAHCHAVAAGVVHKGNVKRIGRRWPSACVQNVFHVLRSRSSQEGKSRSASAWYSPFRKYEACDPAPA